MKSIKDCIVEKGQEKRFFKSEKGKTFELISSSKFDCEVVDIDNCFFKEVTLKRCDYLFLTNRNEDGAGMLKKAFFIELKGDNVKRACGQLYNAIDRTRTEVFQFRSQAIVVGTKGFQQNIANNEFFRKVKKLIGREIRFEKVHKGNNYTHTETI